MWWNYRSKNKSPKEREPEYLFVPKEDITAYETALILSWIRIRSGFSLRGPIRGKLPDFITTEMRRHFEQMPLREDGASG